MYSFVEKYSCIYQHRYYIYACVCVCVCVYIYIYLYYLKFLQIWLNCSIKVGIYVTFSGRPGMLRFMGSQRVRHNWVTDLIWSDRNELFKWLHNVIFTWLIMFHDDFTIYLHVLIEAFFSFFFFGHMERLAGSHSLMGDWTCVMEEKALSPNC